MSKFLIKTLLIITLFSTASFATEDTIIVNNVTYTKDSILRIDYFCLDGKKIKDISLIKEDFIIEQITFKNKSFIFRRRYIL
jgi:hypothetical protein